MGENTKIEWAHHTINFWWGCEKVSEGCANCYAESMSSRFGDLWGKTKPRRLINSAVETALRLNAKAEKDAIRQRVFSQSMSDIFETDHGQPIINMNGERLYVDGDDNIPMTLTHMRSIAFNIIDKTPHLDWLLVTKRPENITRMWPAYFPGGYIPEAGAMNQQGPRSNVWLLTSVENQEQADKRIPELLKCRDLAPVLGLSCEPLLGPVDLTEDENYLNPECWGDCACDSAYGYDAGCRRHGGDGTLERHLDWVIAGGESGNGARPMHPGWAQSLRDQCQSADVPFFFKQWGEYCDERSLENLPCGVLAPEATLPFTPEDLCPMYRVGKQRAGRILDGRTHNEFPLALVHRP
jgi:protein gp37